jgi:hypothetical protein
MQNFEMALGLRIEGLRQFDFFFRLSQLMQKQFIIAWARTNGTLLFLFISLKNF